MTIDFPDYAPKGFSEHYANMPNGVRALYATFERRLKPSWWLSRLLFPQVRTTFETRIDAHGQLCSDYAAAGAVAYHMYNFGIRESEWKYVSWRVLMDKPPVGSGKLAGVAPEDFSVWNPKYGPGNIKTEIHERISL